MGANHCLGTIHNEVPPLTKVHPSQGRMQALPCPKLMHSQISCIPQAYGGPSMPEAHPCSGPICSKGPWGLPCLETIYAGGPSLLRAHQSRGPMEGLPFLETIHVKGIYPCPAPNHPDGTCGSIHAEGPSMPRAHQCQGAIHAESPSMPKAHLCLGLIHLEGPWKPIHAEGLFISRAHDSLSIL